MAKLIRLDVNNFRGIEHMSVDFDPTENMICLIGRGDSGKTSVLEAISCVLSPYYNLTFHDSDFYNTNTVNPIEITASLSDIPPRFLSDDKFGLHVRQYYPQSKKIIDDLLSESREEEGIIILSVKLTVDEHLEPKWTVYTGREQEEKIINGSERAMLNCYMTSDHIDRHFSWAKGNPLYSLLKLNDPDASKEDTNVMLKYIRELKNKVDEHSFDQLAEVTELVKVSAGLLGLNMLKTKTSIDIKELSVKEGKISLHEDAVPFRLKGKGTKRLVSLAIQLALVKHGGIILIDEVEQGLESDRVKHLIRALKDTLKAQIFLTTHSRDVIIELGSSPLRLIVNDRKKSKIDVRRLMYPDEALLKMVRACPEAFFAKKIIVCEGVTEIGLCRALDKHRRTKGKDSMSFLDCAYIDGAGSSLVERATAMQRVGLTVCVVCDSDDTAGVNAQKAGMRASGISVFDCEDLYYIEKQIFKDLPWPAIQQLIQYAISNTYKSDRDAFRSALASRMSSAALAEDWEANDNNTVRTALGETAAAKKWFKRTDNGELVGDVIFSYFDELTEGCGLKNIIKQLNDWIDV